MFGCINHLLQLGHKMDSAYALGSYSMFWFNHAVLSKAPNTALFAVF